MIGTEYTYRPPPWTIWIPLVSCFGPLLVFFVTVAFLPEMWPFGLGGSAIVLVLAWLYARFLWFRDWVIVDDERIRWGLSLRRELRWDDVSESKIVRFLWTDYARVTTRDGKVRWIALNRVGGQELRARVLAALGLD